MILEGHGFPNRLIHGGTVRPRAHECHVRTTTLHSEWSFLLRCRVMVPAVDVVSRVCMGKAVVGALNRNTVQAVSFGHHTGATLAIKWARQPFVSYLCAYVEFSRDASRSDMPWAVDDIRRLPSIQNTETLAINGLTEGTLSHIVRHNMLRAPPAHTTAPLACNSCGSPNQPSI